MTKDIMLGFRITVEQKQALDRIAEQEHTTVSMLVRGLVTDLIKIYESRNELDN